MIIECAMDHHLDLMLGVWINSLTVYDEESVHKSVHRSESVCDENDMMYDESFDEKMWMKRVMWFRDARGEIVACEMWWRVMKSVWCEVWWGERRDSRNYSEEGWGGVAPRATIRRDRILPQIRSSSTWKFSPLIWKFSPSTWNFSSSIWKFSPSIWNF